MKQLDMVAFLEPHLKKLGFPLDDVVGVNFDPNGYTVHFYYRNHGGKLQYHEDIDGVPMGSLFVKYDSPLLP